MKKLYHCRINMLMVRRDGPFPQSDLQKISAMMQAVTDAVDKATGGAIRTYADGGNRAGSRDAPRSESR